MSSAPFCRADVARPAYGDRTDRQAVREVGRLIAGAYDMPAPNPEIDRLCASIGSGTMLR